MFDLIKQIHSVVVNSAKKRVSVYGFIFWLNFSVSALVYVAFALIMTARQYVGDPIDCVATDDLLMGDMLDTYCWIHTTYIDVRELIAEHHEQPPSPGVVASHAKNSQLEPLAYYQWVCFALFFQASACYLPRIVWRTIGAARLQDFIEETMKKEDLIQSNGSSSTAPAAAAASDVERKKNRVQFDRHLVWLRRLTTLEHLGLRYLFCESLTLVVSIAQYFYLLWFLGEHFRNYGLDVINYEPENDPRKIRKFCAFFFHMI